VYFPVALNLKDRMVVVIGGNDEATRKVQGLLACGARLIVVSPTATPTLQQLVARGRLTLCQRGYRYGDLEGALLAVVCDPLHGAEARAEADQRGVLLNVLDRPELCDFIAVAKFSRDGLQFAIHTSGKSAALSRRIREQLEAEFGELYADLTRTLGEMRPVVRRIILSSEHRRRFWLELVSDELLDRVEAGLPPAQLGQEILDRAEAYRRELAGDDRVTLAHGTHDGKAYIEASNHAASGRQ
jgi:precorrin-2 dehydrogenase/sirohydrochlorin ferrochelatase